MTAPHHPFPHFPFSAVVGHEDVKLALLLVAVDPAIGGVLLRGHKGSAKTTLARGLAGVLPGGAPFVELPLGATEDRVVGSIDLAAALTQGHERFRPGLLAAAHGGVLYVDEVNLLADHLVDVLLDVAASGVNRVEREGISHSHPSRFVLIGSMNPEEGELRPQLLDRFGLCVDVVTQADPAERVEAVSRRLEFDADPAAFVTGWTDEDAELARRLGSVPARQRVAPELMAAVSGLCASMEVEGLRGDVVICRAASALAGLAGRDEATVEDVRRVAPFALAHRRRRHPFDEPGVSAQEIDEHLRPPAEVGTDGDSGGPPERAANDGQTRRAPPAPPTDVVRLEAPLLDGRAPSGRRSMTEGDRGMLVGTRPPAGGGPIGSLAVGATARAAASRRLATGAVGGADAGPLVEPGDIREAVRRHRAGNLVILTVDASGSMGAERRMEAAKGAALSLLLDAYQRRDRVAVVTFRAEGADVALRPTGSVEVARARLTELPTGGRTPLDAGIRTALSLAGAGGPGGHRPLIVLISDGRATAASGGADPMASAREAAGAVRRRGVPAVVLDAEDGPSRLGFAAEIATEMGARYLTLPELTAGALDRAIRRLTGS